MLREKEELARQKEEIAL